MNIIFSKTIHPALKVKRSEDVPTIQIIVTPDNEVCNKSFEYDYEWKVFDGKFPLHYEDECKLNLYFKYY